MRYLLLVYVLWPRSLALGQGAERLGLEFGLCPAYVQFDPLLADNWVGSKAQLGTMVDASLNWYSLGDSSAFGLGGGVFLWGDRLLMPAYAQLKINLSSLYRDRTKATGFTKHTSLEMRVGTMFGPVETTFGPLKPRLTYVAAMLYRVSRTTRPGMSVGIQMGMFDWSGPYQTNTNGEWSEDRPSIFWVGPALRWSFR